MGMPVSANNDTKITTILNQYSFYQDADCVLKNEMFTSARLIELTTGSFFFQRGSRIEHLALLGTGRVRVFVVGEGGREITIYHVHPGDSCPINILSMLLNKESPAIAVVEDPIQAVIIEANQVKRWINEQAVMRQYIFESFAARMVDVLSLFGEMKFCKLAPRLAGLLIKQLPDIESTPPVIKVTHERLASELGSSREVISRLLGEYERMGFVELARGRIFINNKQALQNIAST